MDSAKSRSTPPTNLTAQHPPLPLDVLRHLQSEIATGASLDPKLEAALRALVRAHPLLNYIWETGHVFWRGRTRGASQRYSRLGEMLWPPPAVSRQGRSNLAGEPILYVGDHIPTVVAELSDGSGGPMQFIGLEIRPGETARFLPIGELANIATQGQSLVAKDHDSIRAVRGVLGACPGDEAQRLVLADSLIFEAFSLPGRHDFASVIANEMRSNLPDFDGVMYRSTKKPGALNVALRPTSAAAKFQVMAGLAADHCAIGDSGECRIEGIEPVTSIDASDAFVWSGMKQSHTQMQAFETPVAIPKLKT